MAHTNGSIPKHGEEFRAMQTSQLKAEVDFYKGLAESYADELRNIEHAINEYGYWTFTDINGNEIRLQEKDNAKEA